MKRWMLILLFILLLPAVGYLITRFIIGELPMHDSMFVLLAGCLVVATFLTIPYLMLKAVFHEAHKRDANEDDLHLKDLPKDAPIYQNQRKDSYNTLSRATDSDAA